MKDEFENAVLKCKDHFLKMSPEQQKKALAKTDEIIANEPDSDVQEILISIKDWLIAASEVKDEKEI